MDLTISEGLVEKVPGGWIFSPYEVSFNEENAELFGKLFLAHQFQFTNGFLKNLEKFHLCTRDVPDAALIERCNQLVFRIWNPKKRGKEERGVSLAFVRGASEYVRDLLEKSTVYECYLSKRKKINEAVSSNPSMDDSEYRNKSFIESVLEKSPQNLTPLLKGDLGLLYASFEADIINGLASRVLCASNPAQAKINVAAWSQEAVKLFLDSDPDFLKGINMFTIRVRPKLTVQSS